MIDVEIPDEMEYEQINQTIKNKIKDYYLSFNEAEKGIHDIPLNNKETKNQIEKEYEPIFNSFKNEIILDINDIQNEIKSFKLNRYKVKDALSDKLKINNEIHSLVNNINTLKNENALVNNLVSNIEKEKNKRNIDLVSKKNILFESYEKNNKILDLINDNCKANQKFLGDFITQNPKYSLNKLRKKFESFINEMNNITFSQSKDIFNDYEKKSLSIKSNIEKIKDFLQLLMKIINSIKEEEKNIQVLFNIKNTIKLNNNIISEYHNKLEQADKTIKLLEEQISNNINKLNQIKNNVLNPIQIENKQIEGKINNLKKSLIKKSDFEEIKNNFRPLNEDISTLNYKENFNESQKEKLIKSLDNFKKDILNFIKKIEFYNYLSNLDEKMSKITNDLNEKIKIVEENERNLNDLLTNFIQNQNDNLNNVKKEINKTEQEVGNIQFFLNENKNKINSNNQNIVFLQNKFLESNENIKNMNYINNIITQEKLDIIDLENKLLEVEKRIENEPIENIEYRNSLMKSINNCIYENNKNMNEIIKKGLLNKEKKTNLFIYLNDIEKNIINNKKFLEDLIDNFIETQKKINVRNKEDISLINIKKKDKFSQNDYDTLEKLYKIEKEIEQISGKFNSLIDTFQGNFQIIQNKRINLTELKKETEKEIEDFKFILDEKINDYIENNEYNFSKSNIYS